MIHHNLRKFLLVLHCAMLKELLCHVVPELMLTQTRSIIEYLINQRLDLDLAAVLEQSLDNAATKAMPHSVPCTMWNCHDLVNNKLCSILIHRDDELLEDMVCVFALNRLPHV